MERRRGFTLRFAVNAIVLVSVIVTVTISAIVGYRSEKNSLTQTTYQMNQVYVDKISDTVNELFDNMFDSLNEFGLFLIEDLKRQDLHERFELFQRTQKNFNAVFFIDHEGYLVESSGEVTRGARTKIDTIGVTQSLEERRPLISEPYVSKTTNKLIIMVSYPLLDANGAYLGFIGGSIRLHETSIFQTILGNSPFQDDGTYAYVTNDSGLLLYHPDASRIGEDISHSPISTAVKTHENGQLKFVNTRGITMLASFSYVVAAKWGIVSQTPNDTVLASAQELVKELLLYMLPALLAFVALIYWIVGKLASPFVALAQFASQLSPEQGSKDRLPRIHSWNYEANELGKAFSRAVRHFRYQFDHLVSEAQTDPLTGLYNRRTLDQFVNHHIEKQIPFSVLLMDLDNFKRVNDTFGHDVGDEVLRFLAMALKDMFGDHGVVCRMGGEEFVVLLPDGDISTAAYDAEQVRAYMMNTTSPTGDKVTISIGVANYPTHAMTSELLYRSADDALYQAKRNGRNRVVVASSDNHNDAKLG